MASEPKLVVALEAKVRDFERQMAKAQKSFEKNMDGIARSSLRSEAQVLRSSTAIRKAFAGLGAVFGVSELIRYADTWSDLSSRVGNAAGSMAMAEPVMAKLAEIARRTYSDMGQTAEAYILNASTLRELGYNTQNVIDYTESLNNALVVSGAKGDVAASVMDALSKAMALGKLQGDNLNTVISRGGRVAQALADSMGVSTLELRKLGKEGKITRTELFGITKEMEKLRTEAGEMPATISDAFQLMRNAILLWVGGMDQASQSSAKVAEAIIFVADNFGTLADAALNLSTVLAGALAGKALVSVVTMSGTVVTSIAGVVAAFRAGTIAAGTFYAALGPIAMTVGAVAAAIYLLSTHQSAAVASAEKFDAAVRLNETALDAAKDASGRYTQALRDQIAMQVEAARTAYELADAAFQSAARTAAAFAVMTGFRFAPLDYNMNVKDKEAAAALDVLDKLEQQLKRIDQAGVTKLPGVSGGDDKKGKKTRPDELQREIEKIKARTAALQAETAAQAQINPLIDDYDYAITKARASQDLLNAAKKAGIAITPELRAKIEQLAEGYAQATVAANQLQEAQDNARRSAEEMRDLGKDVMGGFIKDLVQGKSAADALAGALGKIGDKLLDMAMNDLFGRSGGGFGILGSLFGLGGGGTTSFASGIMSGARVGLFHRGGVVGRGGASTTVHPGVFAGAPRYHEGGIAGLKPGELPAILQKGEVVLPRGSSVGGGSISAPVNITIDARGADREGLARVEQQVAKLKGELPSRVTQAIRQANKSNVKFG